MYVRLFAAAEGGIESHGCRHPQIMAGFPPLDCATIVPHLKLHISFH